MRADYLDDAIAEAKRFLLKAEGLKKTVAKRVSAEKQWARDNGRPYLPSNSANVGPESSSVRRASMDLTRALSDLRR